VAFFSVVGLILCPFTCRVCVNCELFIVKSSVSIRRASFFFNKVRIWAATEGKRIEYHYDDAYAEWTATPEELYFRNSGATKKRSSLFVKKSRLFWIFRYFRRITFSQRDTSYNFSCIMPHRRDVCSLCNGYYSTRYYLMTRILSRFLRKM